MIILVVVILLWNCILEREAERQLCKAIVSVFWPFRFLNVRKLGRVQKVREGGGEGRKGYACPFVHERSFLIGAAW